MMRKNTEDALAVPFIILIAILILIAGFFAFMYFQHGNAQQVVPVESGTCKCPDIADLENRLGEANAAIAEYQVAIQEVKGMDAKNGKATMYSDDLYTYEQENVQLAINSVHKAGTHSGNGDTDTACETKVDAPTSCLKGSFQSHENVHSESCQKIKQELGAKYSPLTTDYRESMTMAEFWNNEIAAYSAEIAYINKNLPAARADNSCQWTCDVDGKSYNNHEECERSCRPTLGSNIKTGFRCTNKASP